MRQKTDYAFFPIKQSPHLLLPSHVSTPFDRQHLLQASTRIALISRKLSDFAKTAVYRIYAAKSPTAIRTGIIIEFFFIASTIQIHFLHSTSNRETHHLIDE